jgi:repressor LexA
MDAKLDTMDAKLDGGSRFDGRRFDDLSPRQKDVLDFISARITQRGIPPTYREIGDAIGISSTNGVADHIKALVRKGYVRKEPSGTARGLQLTTKAGQAREGATIAVPLVGTVAAGSPILAEQNHDGTMYMGADMLPRKGTVFALKVRGESMIEEGIHDGDVVFVHQRPDVRNGDIVVALIDGEATVKYFFRERDRVRLDPAHPTMKPIYVNENNDASIQGVVVGVYRQY